MREIVPVAQFDRRMPQAGRIKIGERTAKAMRALNTFRFVSPYKDAIDTIASEYGGTVNSYHDEKSSPPNQWQVTTEANEIDVYLVPGGLDTQYEEWSGGGCVRRCDGVNVEIPVKVGGGYDLDTHPCLCRLEGERKCDPITRLVVILPRLAFRGGWMLQTKSWNAAVEMPGMHDMLNALGQGGMISAKLGVEQRTKATVAGKRNFVVPRLSVATSALELQQGMATVTAIAAPRHAALSAPVAGELGAGVDDDGIADAEVIDPEMERVEAMLRADAVNFGIDPDAWLAAMHTHTRSDLVRMENASKLVRTGTVVPILDESGVHLVRKDAGA